MILAEFGYDKQGFFSIGAGFEKIVVILDNIHYNVRCMANIDLGRGMVV